MKTIRIAYIGREEQDASTFRNLLQDTDGYQFQVVFRAIASLDGRELQSDLLLLESQACGADSGQEIEAIRKIYPLLPIILLQHKSNPAEALAAVQSGVQDTLVFGEFNLEKLTRSIIYSIERHNQVQQIQKARQIEKYLAYHDALTGLPSRQLFLDRLGQAIMRARRNNYITGILFLDLDGFKRINDTLGHSTGDKLLVEVGKRIEECVRESDTVARLGGDEFTVLLGRIEHEQDAANVAKKILQALNASIRVENNELFVTTSIGISLYPEDGNDVETLVKKADVAMYRAKSRGKNTYQLYNFSMDSDAAERLELENNLHRGLARDELVLFYQPLLDVKDAQVTSLEALVRWQHPTKGLISPDRFIPLAEETGLIEPLGEWVLRTACRQNKLLQERGFSPLRVAVNLSMRQFRQKALHGLVLETLESSRLDPRYLALEVTESNAMNDVEHTISTLKLLKDIGVRVSIDDFGTGYSSLSYLKRLPIDTLKVDRSFIDGIPEDKDDKSITSAIIFLAHNLELGVIAEGVETRKQLSFLKAMRCDKIQGYHFSKPLAFDGLQEFLVSADRANFS